MDILFKNDDFVFSYRVALTKVNVARENQEIALPD